MAVFVEKLFRGEVKILRDPKLGESRTVAPDEVVVLGTLNPGDKPLEVDVFSPNVEGYDRAVLKVQNLEGSGMFDGFPLLALVEERKVGGRWEGRCFRDLVNVRGAIFPTAYEIQEHFSTADAGKNGRDFLVRIRQDNK